LPAEDTVPVVRTPTRARQQQRPDRLATRNRAAATGGAGLVPPGMPGNASSAPPATSKIARVRRTTRSGQCRGMSGERLFKATTRDSGAGLISYGCYFLRAFGQRTSCEERSTSRVARMSRVLPAVRAGGAGGRGRPPGSVGLLPAALRVAAALPCLAPRLLGSFAEAHSSPWPPRSRRPGLAARLGTAAATASPGHSSPAWAQHPSLRGRRSRPLLRAARQLPAAAAGLLSPGAPRPPPPDRPPGPTRKQFRDMISPAWNVE